VASGSHNLGGNGMAMGWATGWATGCGYGPLWSLLRSVRVCTLFYERKLDDALVQMSTLKACITMLAPLVALGPVSCRQTLSTGEITRRAVRRCDPDLQAAMLQLSSVRVKKHLSHKQGSTIRAHA
jgi:hypothetical protein